MRPARPAAGWSWMWPPVTLLVLFALTRLVARGALGLRFFDHTLGYWQVLDPTLLKTDLVRSCFFLHSQPPLFNLVLGVALKAAPATGALLDLLFLGTSYLGLVGIYALLVELGTPRSAALAAASLQAFSTTWIVYESWLFYTLPTAVLLTWTCVFMGRACRGSRAAIPASAALVSAVAMLRSSYHLVWVVFALGLLLWVVRSRPAAHRRTARRAAAAALGLVLALYAKNELLVGSFSASSWVGLSLARMTTGRLDPAYREMWIRSGGLGAVAAVPSFSPLEAYPAALRAVPEGTPSHPALVEPHRGDGEPNFNHVAYVRIARAHLEAARTVLRRRPDVYLDSVRRAVGTWLRPPTEYEFVEHLRARLLLWDRLHSRLLLWAPPGQNGSGPTFVLLGAALLCGIAVLASPPRERSRILCVLTLPVVTIAANLVTGTLVEFEENNRFRVEVEALMFALGAWGAIDLCRRWLSRLGSSSP